MDTQSLDPGISQWKSRLQDVNVVHKQIPGLGSTIKGFSPQGYYVTKELQFILY